MRRVTACKWSGRGRVGARLAAVLAAAALLAAACSSGASRTASTRPDARGSGSAVAAKPATGTDSGVLTTIAGTRVRVPSGKPSVLVFISVGCADCAAAAKAVAQASQALRGGASVLGVDLDPGLPASQMHSFLDYVGAPQLPVVIDDAKFTLAKTYRVSALSTVLVVSRAGRVTFRAVNPSPEAIESAVHAAS